MLTEIKIDDEMEDKLSENLTQTGIANNIFKTRLELHLNMLPHDPVEFLS